MSELSDLLNRTGISARQAAERAKELGVELPYGTIAAYWTGKHPRNPSEKTLEGLAEVTAVSVRRLRRAAGKAEGETQPWHPPTEANRLTQRQRAALDQLIKAIVDTPYTVSLSGGHAGGGESLLDIMEGKQAQDRGAAG